MKAETIVKSGYKQIGELYHRRRLKSTGSSDLLNKLIKKMPKSGKVLDVGCGGGYPVAKFFVDRKYDVTGIDISPEMIKIAKKTVPKGKFFVKDMRKMNFPNNSFDIIVSFFAIIHVPREHHKRIISNFYRMLKPKGVILICMGLVEAESYIKEWHGVEMHWSIFDKKTNLKLVRQAGFKIIWNKDLGPKTDRHTWILAKK